MAEAAVVPEAAGSVLLVVVAHLLLAPATSSAAGTPAVALVATPSGVVAVRACGAALAPSVLLVRPAHLCLLVLGLAHAKRATATTATERSGGLPKGGGRWRPPGIRDARRWCGCWSTPTSRHTPRGPTTPGASRRSRSRGSGAPSGCGSRRAPSVGDTATATTTATRRSPGVRDAATATATARACVLEVAVVAEFARARVLPVIAHLLALALALPFALVTSHRDRADACSRTLRLPTSAHYRAPGHAVTLTAHFYERAPWSLAPCLSRTTHGTTVVSCRLVRCSPLSCYFVQTVIYRCIDISSSSATIPSGHPHAHHGRPTRGSESLLCTRVAGC